MGNIIETKKLCKTFSNGGLQQHVLKNIDLEIYEGDYTIIMGASGAGKSTLLYTLSGMDKPTLGQISFNNKEITKMTIDKLAQFRRKNCGFVFQQTYLIDSMSVLDNVLVSGLLVNNNKKEVVKNAKEILKKVDIKEELWTKFPTQLSGGEAQRVGIARALINNPKLVFADEPTGALNSKTGKDVLDTLTEFNNKGQSIVMVTHDIKSARRGNRIIYLKDGEIVGECNLGKYRKNKGLSICIALLILIGAIFLCVSCLLVFDFQKSSYKEAERLNASDAAIYSSGNAGNITKEYIDSIIPDSVSDYLYTEDLFVQTSIKFNEGEITPYVNFIKSEALNRNISKIEIIEEDTSIIDNYIYIPYHIHTGGGINIGDTYEIKFPTNTYSFKVKGYINTIYGGSYNMNQYHMLISDEDYAKIENDNPTSKSFTLYINYKENFKDTSILKESNKIVREIFIDKNIETIVAPLNTTIESRTFLSMILKNKQ